MNSEAGMNEKHVPCSRVLSAQVCGRYGEVEVRVGVRLVLQREMPPLAIDGLEAVVHHGVAQNHAVLVLLVDPGSRGARSR